MSKFRNESLHGMFPLATCQVWLVHPQFLIITCVTMDDLYKNQGQALEVSSLHLPQKYK